MQMATIPAAESREKSLAPILQTSTPHASLEWVSPMRMSALTIKPTFARDASALVSSCRRLASSSSIRGGAWMTLSELGNRIFRIVTAVALARSLSTVEFATMSLVLSIYELVRMLVYNGVGARVVQAHEEELDDVCVAVNRVNWFVGIAMSAAQLLIAWPLQALYQTNIAGMLAALAVVHLIYPLGMTHGSLAQRREQLGFVATMQFVQITGDNILTAILALFGFGVWAVVVPKILIAIVWVAANVHYVPRWRNLPLSREALKDVIRYARYVLGAEALNTLRTQGDRMIIGKALSMEAFGIFTFAANAGAGVATGLTSALGQVALPFLAKGRGAEGDMIARFWRTAAAMSLVIAPIVLLQAALAPWYVPIVFGERWTPAIPTLVILCLTTLARPIGVATTQMLRASGAVEMEMRISKWSAAIYFIALFCGLPFGVQNVAVALLIGTVAPTFYFAKAALDHVAAHRATHPDSNRSFEVVQ